MSHIGLDCLEFSQGGFTQTDTAGSQVIAQIELPQGQSLKPFLKWAGGKRWLVERHSSKFPTFDGKYIEPFLGGGSVFFHLSPRKSIISDSNGRLIECYRQVRDNNQELLRILAQHHEKHSETYYYDIRAYEFCNEIERAAQFIYLNRTCFNGLYRVNTKGVFNVPIGSKSKVVDEHDNFLEISTLLALADIQHCDFEITIDRAGIGDFLFVDPPYTVKHNLNGFLKYNEKIFSWDDQIRLRDAIVRAADRGAKVLLTNAAHASVMALYENVAELRFVKRSSVLAGKSAARGSVEEMIVMIG